MKKSVKVYFSTGDVALILGVSVKTARKLLKREGACRKMGKRWVTTRERLQAAFPEVFQGFARL
jgi:hypothetical protein